jgi:hypothetical protein
MKKTVKKYSVRGGTKDGAYIKPASISFSKRTGRKYAWCNYKNERAILTYNVACGVAQSYGGTLVAE